MKNLTKITLAIAITICCVATKAQTIQYDYDDAGNRTSRTIYFPRKANPNPTQDQQTFSDALGESKIAIYPNPTKGEMTVEMQNRPESADAQIALYDLTGKTVYQSNVAAQTTRVNITELPGGTYIMKILIGDKISQWKIIKE